MSIFEGLSVVNHEFPLAIMMETVDFLVANKSQFVRQYLPDVNEEGFYKDCRLLLRHREHGNRHIWYDLRPQDSVANLGFFQASMLDADYEFEFDDRFVLSMREVCQGEHVDSRRIVLSHDGEVRLHRQYFEKHLPSGLSAGEMMDGSPDEVRKILVELFNDSEDIWPTDLLASDEPGLREFGLDVYYRSLLPNNP